MMVNKRGSHVGIVLSFVVFITFLLFVFSYLNPAFEEQRSKRLNLDLLKDNLFDSLLSNLSVTSLKVSSNHTYQEDCFFIEDFVEIDDSYTKIRDEENNPINGSSVVTIPPIVEINHSSRKFFRIFHSLGFEPFVPGGGRSEYVSPCEELPVENYTLGSTRVSEYVFRSEIDELLFDYDNDYSKLKNDLGVSEFNEFGVAFVNESGNEIQRGFDINVSGNIYIEEIPIQYYDSEANIQSGSIKLRVW